MGDKHLTVKLAEAGWPAEAKSVTDLEKQNKAQIGNKNNEEETSPLTSSSEETKMANQAVDQAEPKPRGSKKINGKVEDTEPDLDLGESVWSKMTSAAATAAGDESVRTMFRVGGVVAATGALFKLTRLGDLASSAIKVLNKTLGGDETEE